MRNFHIAPKVRKHRINSVIKTKCHRQRQQSSFLFLILVPFLLYLNLSFFLSVTLKTGPRSILRWDKRNNLCCCLFQEIKHAKYHTIIQSMAGYKSPAYCMCLLFLLFYNEGLCDGIPSTWRWINSVILLGKATQALITDPYFNYSYGLAAIYDVRKTD